MIDPYSRLMANQEKSKKPLISNPSNVDASISQRNSELDERLSALDRYSSSGRSDSSNNYFSSGVSESGQTQGSVLPSGVRITQAFGAYNPNVEVFSQGGRNWGTDFGVKEGTPLALPPGVWQVMEAYDRASGRGRIGNKENKGYGNSILVRNVETGETLRFSHLSGVNVMPGKTYQGGTVIGASGATGNATGAHLDLEYKNPQGQYRDILKSPYAQNLFGSSGMGGGGYGRGGGFNMGEIKESIGQKFGGLKDQVKAYPKAFMTNLPITPEKQKAFNTNIQYALGDGVGGKEGINNPNVMKAQGFNNWFFSPLMQVPYNVKEAVAPDKTGWERVGHGLNAGLAFTPGVDDLVSAGLNAVKTAVAERDGDFLGAFADGLVGNQYTGLGDAVTKRNPDKQNLANWLNVAEIPLRIAGGAWSVKNAQKRAEEAVKGVSSQQVSANNQQVGKVNLNKDGFIKEAQKYKSAEEFVKGQGEKFIHETNAPDIKEFKLGKAGENTQDSWLGRGVYFQKDGTFKIEKYGKNKVEAYLKPDTKVFKIKETPNGKWRDNFVEMMANKNPNMEKEMLTEYNKIAMRPTEEGFNKYRQNVLARDFLMNKSPEEVKKMIGDYDAILQDGELVVFNPEQIKTKSQLTELWNEANLDGIEMPENIVNARFKDQVIPEFKKNIIRQANDNNMSPIAYYQKVLDDIDKGIKIAEQQQKDFAKRISDFASENGVDFEVGGVKGRGRITTKTINEESGNVDGVKDMNRSVIFSKNLNHDLKSLAEKANKYFGENETDGFRVKYYKSDDLYKKVIINFHGSKGQLTEMQITTPAMWRAKIDLGGDVLYHKWREIPDTSTGDLLEEKKELFREMRSLYNKAFIESEGLPRTVQMHSQNLVKNVGNKLTL